MMRHLSHNAPLPWGAWAWVAHYSMLDTLTMIVTEYVGLRFNLVVYRIYYRVCVLCSERTAGGTDGTRCTLRTMAEADENAPEGFQNVVR